MRGILQLLPFLFIVLVVISIARNAAKVIRKVGEQAAAPGSPADYDPEQAARTRRIQEEIRRKIAERRGLGIPAELLAAPEPEPRPEPPVRPAEDDLAGFAPTTTHAAILERQQQLSDQMRALEAARVAGQRKAAQTAAAVKTETDSERGMLVGTRGDLLADLRDPASLKRAIVLREVLGPPVGLR